MPKKLRHDVAETAFRTMLEATGERPKTDPESKDPEAVRRGQKGGQKGGAARAKALTPEARKASAKKAAEARWGAKK